MLEKFVRKHENGVFTLNKKINGLKKLSKTLFTTRIVTFQSINSDAKFHWNLQIRNFEYFDENFESGHSAFEEKAGSGESCREKENMFSFLELLSFEKRAQKSSHFQCNQIRIKAKR